MGLGGTDSSAQQLTLKQNQETLDLIERQTQRATRDVSKLFGSAEQNLLAGNQAALGVMQQQVPQQFSALQQGNLGAQQQVLAGLPQMQNALLGLPTDLSGFQPRQAQVDTSFLQSAQMPRFQTGQEALALSQPEQAQEFQFGIDAELGRLPYYTGGSLRGIGQATSALSGAIEGLSPTARGQFMRAGGMRAPSSGKIIDQLEFLERGNI